MRNQFDKADLTSTQEKITTLQVAWALYFPDIKLPNASRLLYWARSLGVPQALAGFEFVAAHGGGRAAVDAELSRIRNQQHRQKQDALLSPQIC